MRTAKGQADFERKQKIARACREYQEGKITAAECMRRCQEAEKND